MPVTCFVSYELHPTTMGGAGVLIHHAAEALLRADHEVVFLLDIPADAFARLIHQDLKQFPHAERVRAYRVEELCPDVPLHAAAFNCVFQWKSYQFAWALRKLLEREAVDFVECFEYCGAGYYAFSQRLFDPYPPGARPPVLGSRLHGSLEILDRHGQGAVRDRDRYILHALERRALALSEVILSPSRTYFERYYHPLYGIEPDRVVVSSPPKQAFPAVTRRPSATGEFSIAFIGRMFHLKGVDQFVNACVQLMKRRPELRCTVDLIGYDSVDESVPGSYASYLRTLMPADLRTRFRFHGQLSHDQIADRLNNALFAVFPNRVESFCYALHEVYDAGVPVIINDLPAFADFFTHEKNAIVYNGTTPALAAAMERMIGESALRERLCRPYRVAEEPIGGFYDAPRPLAPLISSPHAPTRIESLVIILGNDANPSAWPAVKTLQTQNQQAARVVCLCPAPADPGLRWLGHGWNAVTPEGTPIEASDLSTATALLVLESHDVLDPIYLEVCSRALGRTTGAFAGTWTAINGTAVPSVLDVAPELWPFEQGSAHPRALLRTEAGVLLTELLDPSLGGLGLIGLFWYTIARDGHGVLSPHPLLQASTEPRVAPSSELQALLLRFGAPFAERLTHIAGLMHAQAQGTPAVPPPTTEQKIRLADELGGSLLARMAIKKIVRRARAGGRRPS